MRVAFLFPQWSGKDAFTGHMGLFLAGRWHPLGMLSVAATMREAGHEVKFFDGGFMTQDQMIPEVQKYDPHVVGIYLTTFLFRSTKALAERIRRDLPNVFILLGGPLASGWRDRALKEIPAADAICIGEGEITGTEVANTLAAGGDLSKVLGIAWRERNGDVVHLNEPRPPIPDLDVLPLPARDLVDIYRYKPPLGTYQRLPAVYMFSSRGCNGKCIFCWQLRAEGNYRARSAAKVLEEIDHCYNTYKIKEIRFYDDNLVYDQERIDAVLDGLIERDYDLTLYGSARTDDIRRETLFKMKKAKFWGVLFGIETGVQKNLDALCKGTTVEQNTRAVKWAKEAKLKTVTPMIFGIPGETFEEGLQSIEYAIKLDGDITNFHSLAPFPGAEVYDNVSKYGTIVTDNINDFTFEGCAFVPYTMTRQEIEELRKIAFRRYYRRPKYLWRRVTSIRTWTEFKTMLAFGATFVLATFMNREFTPHGAQA